MSRVINEVLFPFGHGIMTLKVGDPDKGDSIVHRIEYHEDPEPCYLLFVAKPNDRGAYEALEDPAACLFLRTGVIERYSRTTPELEVS